MTRRAWTKRFLPVGLVLSICGHAIAGDSTPIDKAITKAQHWILDNEKDGNWEQLAKGYEPQETGWTAIALNALLSSGVNSQDPAVSKAVDYLKKTETSGVYALGMRMQVWMRLPASAEVRAAALKDSNKLFKGMGTKGDAKGMYGYLVNDGGYSHSRSQYGVLGMAAARQMGIEVPDAYWKLIENTWIEHQQPDGSWGYKKALSEKYPATAGMTTAGAASLFLAAEALHESETINCTGTVELPAITKALAWLSAHNNEIASEESFSQNVPYSALYGFERAGTAAGIKYFGNVNWFKKGSDWLVANQTRDGSWKRAGRDYASMAGLADTCFALLFLAHGRAPVFMEKLNYSADPPKSSEWNQRPRDVANLARRTGLELEQELSWEVVTPDSPVDDYHDAPILYISGKSAITINEATKAKLREFVQGGGMIVANADCGGSGFAGSFRKLAIEISPYEFRNLPKDHPIYTRQQYPSSRWKTKPMVLGLSNGVRELMILISTADPAKTWQQGVYSGKEPAWELGADLFEYVASRTHLRSRGESYVVARDNSVTATSTVVIGRAKYGGNWDPEAGGWRRLSNVMHNRRKIDLDVKPVAIDGDLKGMPVVHLTGTQLYHPSDATLQHLKDYVTGGGTLVVDAAGGSVDFGASVESELAKTFGSASTVIPPGDAMYASGGVKLAPVKYRSFASDRLGNLNQPRVKGFKVGDRWGVVFSGEDLSAGLVGQPVDGVIGYEPDTATDIMQHVIEYATAKK